MDRCYNIWTDVIRLDSMMYECMMYESGCMNIWISRCMNIMSGDLDIMSGHLYVWTSGHMDIWTYGHDVWTYGHHIWTYGHGVQMCEHHMSSMMYECMMYESGCMNIWIPRCMNIMSGHLDIMSGHLYVWTSGHMDIWTMDMMSGHMDIISGHMDMMSTCVNIICPYDVQICPDMMSRCLDMSICSYDVQIVLDIWTSCPYVQIMFWTSGHLDIMSICPDVHHVQMSRQLTHATLVPL